MFNDRYGKSLFSKHSIVVFDTSYSDPEIEEDELGYRVENFDKAKFETAYEVDVGAGADWPVIAQAMLETSMPLGAVLGALFFGEKLEASVAAWTRMVKTLLSAIPDNGFTDANGAAVIALEEVFAQTGANDVQLVAYTWVDGALDFHDQPDKKIVAFDMIAKMNEIRPLDEQFGQGLHGKPTFLFKFKIDDGFVLAQVKNTDCTLLIQ